MSAQRLGVFICHCGGNISDYVDVEKVRAATEALPGCTVAKTFMFACSDAAQQEMMEEIRKEKLDGMVIASCSPKLHLETFRAMAKRAGLNPHMYSHVNVREQCSWAHRHDVGKASEKATRLVRAGAARAALGRPLENIRVETVPAVLVVGAGVTGLRAAIALSDQGLSVHLVEREAEVGGRVRTLGKLFPSGRPGGELVASLRERLAGRENVVVYTNAELVEKSGSAGRFEVKVRSGENTFSLKVGAIVAATGFAPYAPQPGEFGHGLPAVVTLPEFNEMLTASRGNLRVNGRDVHTIAYIYCVGSRQPEGNTYCSRYCCTAGVHAAIQAQEIDPAINQFHLFRDMRTYGKNELLYEEARHKGSVFIRYGESEPPEVEQEGEGLVVRVRDELSGGDTIEIPADLVVLVTGMVAGSNERLQNLLKLPTGPGGFFNEIHLKLRPVETVVDGVFIAGAAQAPKNLAESVASSLAATAQCSAMLLKGYLDRAPLVAKVDADACTWCEVCTEACPYDGTIMKVEHEGKEVAEVRAELCKGCGACASVCPSAAIDVEGYTNAQVTAMIDALAAEVTT
ncbi:MAG: CoB--CoM heterodisulfide reductase iron-sulfur subunit A family protein [Alphaproteobacteria bacterium]|nr:CoB--CoM heterodisulfide reductase iron-sulfur subunit A family protein [Alphaproteobacteria bacterium]MDE2163365.1 CoB--CoM heterodisulfide reductase iron-sulfur subunit A family protein [Alphaproteobacteria bacterium]MDE2500572.1 CoB--CoM heterodisulfide reductase iron-sulfur subunit A family protein [Alphaproteobacteria bacterium]